MQIYHFLSFSIYKTLETLYTSALILAEKSMKRTTLDLLACPACRSELSLMTNSGDGVIETGRLSCLTCQKIFLIQHGIPRFIREDELEGRNKTFAHLYNWFSLIYTSFSKVGFRLLGTSDSLARQQLLARLEPKGGKVLEVSIGPGINLPYLLKMPMVGEVFGLDISTGQLNRCRTLIQRKGWKVDIFLGNGEELPFKDNSFESVFHIGGINFFNHQQKAIDEMIRVAKPGTKIIICDENENGASWYEKFLPGFKGAFHGQREAVSAPVRLVPSTMSEVNLTNIWNGFMYCLEFRKP
jgi:ubiquinone/menaquinone biosynthesis C-methylase UbiE/uncharacterized protein YbaR (Trm112 family)